MLLIALGSRGDVQPMAVLARALADLGEPVAVLALTEFEDLVAGYGVDFVGVPGRIGDALDLGPGPALTRRLLTSEWGQLAALRRWVAGLAHPVARAAWKAARDHEVVVTGILTAGLGSVLAAAGSKTATLLFSGLAPTTHRSSHFMAHHFTPWTAYNRLAVDTNWRLAVGMGGVIARAAEGRLPADTRAAVMARVRPPLTHPIVIAASPILVPPAPDWPATTVQTGTLVGTLSPGDRAIPTGVEEFLAAGPAPVYIGFGSMAEGLTGADLDGLADLAAVTGQRIVTPTLPDLPPGPHGRDVLVIEPVAHAGLFPRMAAVVHHGGAGTTFAGLRAGVPSSAVAFGTDQPYHARRLVQLGVGPAAPRVAQLLGGRRAAGRMARLVTDLTTGPRADAYRSRAAQLGQAARAEDGVGATIAAFHRLGYLGGTGQNRSV